MHTLTVRGLDPEITQRLKQVAQERHMSVNKFILEAIQTHLGMNKRRSSPHPLDKYFGKWDQAEFDRVMKNVEEQRQIDTELWK